MQRGLALTVSMHKMKWEVLKYHLHSEESCTANKPAKLLMATTNNHIEQYCAHVWCYA